MGFNQVFASFFLSLNEHKIKWLNLTIQALFLRVLRNSLIKVHVSISQTKVLMFYFFSLKKCRNVCSFQRKTTVLETLISTLKTHVQLQREKILEFRCRHLYAICPENHYLQDVCYIIVQLSISLISLVWILLSSKKKKPFQFRM